VGPPDSLLSGCSFFLGALTAYALLTLRDTPGCRVHQEHTPALKNNVSFLPFYPGAFYRRVLLPVSLTNTNPSPRNLLPAAQLPKGRTPGSLCFFFSLKSNQYHLFSRARGVFVFPVPLWVPRRLATPQAHVDKTIGFFLFSSCRFFACSPSAGCPPLLPSSGGHSHETQNCYVFFEFSFLFSPRPHRHRLIRFPPVKWNIVDPPQSVPLSRILVFLAWGLLSLASFFNKVGLFSPFMTQRFRSGLPPFSKECGRVRLEIPFPSYRSYSRPSLFQISLNRGPFLFPCLFLHFRQASTLGAPLRR